MKSGFRAALAIVVLALVGGGIYYSGYFKSKEHKTDVVLVDKEGNLAVILESYDCWETANEGEKTRGCHTIEDAVKNGPDHLAGFRSHHVIYMGKEFAFVESWRRGAPAYKVGAFDWDKKDVVEYIKVPISFTGGSDEEMKFSFSSKLKPPFESLSEPPAALEGKDFVLRKPQ